MTSIIPQQLLSSWSSGMRQSDALKIKCLCEVREYIRRHKDIFPIGEMQAEAARALGVPKATLRDYLGIVREYDMETMYHWLEVGLSFHHIELANRLRPDNPESLLQEAVDLQGPSGGETMTCDEMTVFALGDQPRSTPMFRLNDLLSRFPKFVNRLPLDKQDKARELCREFEDGMRKLFESEE